MNTDFDFQNGTWAVAHRQLVKALAGCTEWKDFTSTSVVHGFFGGAGSFEEHTFHDHGTGGVAMRLYDPAAEHWTIYWVSSRDGRLQTPVTGRFTDGVGLFEGDEEFEGRPIKTRFFWSEITATSARWHQDFSDDGGRTWETNWIMEFTRV
ncbi:hypothetical protein [Hamadaea tsunoensis]|uniref:hypothetical protein n=1 Tax=Hamadaea tsunoensis TaxID=53368 RepID=UPI00041A3A6B|nr:hypothetical protein [Hamadaea tsunoensis]